MSEPLRLVVLVSGRGSNLHALRNAIERGECRAQIVAVLTDRAHAPALAIAAQHQLVTRVLSPRSFADRPGFDAALTEEVASFAPDLVVLAGFMRILGAQFVDRFMGRIINVHPSLLPAFPGKDGPAQALAKRVCVSGCTVHLVDHGVDSGPILAQAVVPVLPDDDVATLHARIQVAERRLFPAVVHALATGVLGLDGSRPAAPAALPDVLYWPALSP